AAGRNAWDLAERNYPLVVEETITRLVWVAADSEEAALDQLADEPWEYKGEAIDSSAEARRPDEFERRNALAYSSSAAGPRIACPDCGALAFRRAWFHSPYRRCHGPIVWEQRGPTSRPYRSWQRTPAYTNGGAA
ncbi:MULTISPECIES: hypothetical protein, partial [unclassified Streptomyces]|uniref:hypothetical protein n=1 Tax=unclassified Streptomyces TaxID=2593676 RepID=UPI00081EE851